jgi:hypothetical protein
MESIVTAALAAKYQIPREAAAQLALEVAQRCALISLRFDGGQHELGAQIGAQLIRDFTPSDESAGDVG